MDDGLLIDDISSIFYRKVIFMPWRSFLIPASIGSVRQSHRIEILTTVGVLQLVFYNADLLAVVRKKIGEDAGS
jgi:hypothetical protein